MRRQTRILLALGVALALWAFVTTQADANDENGSGEYPVLQVVTMGAAACGFGVAQEFGDIPGDMQLRAMLAAVARCVGMGPESLHELGGKVLEEYHRLDLNEEEEEEEDDRDYGPSY